MLFRPQPLGIFPFPAGLLLLPKVEEVERPVAKEALDSLMKGIVPNEWPLAWQSFRSALLNEPDDFELENTASDLECYNHFVVTGDETSRSRAMLSDTLEIKVLTSLAAFIQGAQDTPPDADELDGEIQANVLLAHAALCLEQQNIDSAMKLLSQAIDAAAPVSPLLEAQLLLQAASLSGSRREAESLWRRALDISSDTQLKSLRIDLHYGFAVYLHELAGENRGRLIEAVEQYHLTIQAGITKETHPELWAQIQANLGLAYVSMPMSDAGAKLRPAVAIQAFREALSVYTRDEHPEEWSSTMLNMANAMQYLPSAHQKENLIDAVNAYEELLSVRPRALDPVGYARLLANQGNALAHLGIFGPAVEKLTEAHKLLHWHNEADAATLILEQLQDINTQMTVEAP